MKCILLATVLTFSLGASVSAFAASEAECKAMFAKADANHDGWIEGEEARPYFDAIEKAGLTSSEADQNVDGRLNADEFMAACVKDAFKGLGH